MKSAFRSAICTALEFSLRSLNPNPYRKTLVLLPRYVVVFPAKPSHFTSMASSESGSHAPPSPTVLNLERQFEEFRHQLDDSGNLRERIRSIALEIESATRLMQSSLLLIHQSGPIPEVLEKAKGQIGVLKELYNKLAEIILECPGQYYRYHGDWRSETQTVVSLLAFMHWLETEGLLLHAEAEEKLGLKSSEFGLDTEDYLIGICFMSNDLPRYVVNRVTAGDYDCPRKVLKFLTDLHAAFRMLNLRNDFLRKKFDGMKYDLRRVEEVYYDVKIRGLATTGNTTGEQGDGGQS
ncbi:Translin family protein [Handroanthus impetiginosus]|uniref:Translin family protein n=1 Tax=Handroanthus impetiginosus TaxID=429701 RepID=A0A2G9I0V5_9LAMI|nr:Translin family protein [Handroanthus impetiginosus]